MTSLLRVRTRADRTQGRRPFTRNVGREDRLVRGCIALSLLLLGGFALLQSGRLGLISLLFLLLLGYFSGTAAVGWDALYARTGIDTRSHREFAADGAAAWPDGWHAEAAWSARTWDDGAQWPEPADAQMVLDLTDGARAATRSPDGTPTGTQHPA